MCTKTLADCLLLGKLLRLLPSPLLLFSEQHGNPTLVSESNRRQEPSHSLLLGLFPLPTQPACPRCMFADALAAYRARQAELNRESGTSWCHIVALIWPSG